MPYFPLDVPPPADPDALEALASACGAAAEEHRTVAVGLNGVFENLQAGPQSWKGHASLTYRDAWGNVGGDIERTAEALTTLAARLRWFAAEIRVVQNALRAALEAAAALGPEAPAAQEAARAAAETAFLALDTQMGATLAEILTAIPITRLHLGYVSGLVAEPAKAAAADAAITARKPTTSATTRKHTPGVATLSDPSKFASLADHPSDPGYFRPNRYQIRIPREVAVALNGQQFSSFDEMRKKFWTTMHDAFQKQYGVAFTHDDTLFTAANWERMRGNRPVGKLEPGTAPIAPEIFQINDERKSYEMDHMAEVQYELVGEEDEVYALDNFQVIAPSVHKAKTSLLDVMGPNRVPANYFAALPASIANIGD